MRERKKGERGGRSRRRPETLQVEEHVLLEGGQHPILGS